MKRITTLTFTILSSLTLVYGVEAAPTILSKAAPFLVTMSTEPDLPQNTDEMVDTINEATLELSEATTDDGYAADSDVSPDFDLFSDDSTPDATNDDIFATTNTDTVSDTTPSNVTLADSTDVAVAEDATEPVADNSNDPVTTNNNDDDCECPYAKWETFAFTCGAESFTISFQQTPGAEVVALNGFNLFYNAGDPFSMLVVAPREAGDDKTIDLLQKWRDLLARRYANSSVTQVARGIANLANGLTTVDSLFFVAPEGKFIRVRVILSDNNSYVLSTTFDTNNAENSNLFFESFGIND